VVDDSHIWRDRKLFTKSVLRSFIKKTVTREAWNGAPWLVKHDVADQYNIDTRVPLHLRHDTKLMERKHLQAQKKALQPDGVNPVVNPFASGAQGPVRLPELKPAPKAQKGKQQAQQNGQHPYGGKGKNGVLLPQENHRIVQVFPGNPFQFPLYLQDQLPPPPVYSAPEPPPPPPPPKYPIEDLQVDLRDLTRPALKFMCKDPPVDLEDRPPNAEHIHMKSVGPLLETWDTLNVYCEIFKLDSFTFDDFVEAMLVANEDTEVQLFDEIHCAVLKILVSSEADGGNVQIRLPEIESEDLEEEEDEEEEEPEPEPQPKPATRATRSSLAKAEAERIAAEAAAAEKLNQAEPEIIHRAEELLKDYDWVDHLRKRDFKHGGWEMIMVGLLHQLSKDEVYRESCEALLSQLVPADVEPTQLTVRQHYSALDIDSRVQALQIICMLTTGTKAVRVYMEDCSEQMTAYRKEKIDWQRQRKQA